MARAYLAGDVARVLRENLGTVLGRVALVTVTGPGEISVCPCCGRLPAVRIGSRSDAAAWNLGESAGWRRLASRLKREMMRVHGERPPRVIARVAQRQQRGIDHLHLVMLARTPDELLRVRHWVELYRRYHAAYGFGFVDDPERPDRNGRTRLFENAGIAGAYLGRYLAGGQLERFLEASDRSWRAVWVSPVLQARTGWTLGRCRWLRQAWALRTGVWDRRTWYGTARMPGWWHDDSHRAWVLAVTGWDGVVPGAAFSRASLCPV